MAVNPIFSKDLYLGESINPQDLDKIKKKLKRKPLISGVYLIALSKNPSDQLEIYKANQLAQSYYEKNPPYIIGITGNYDEAVKTVEQIVKECMDKRGDCSLKEYLLCGK